LKEASAIQHAVILNAVGEYISSLLAQGQNGAFRAQPVPLKYPHLESILPNHFGCLMLPKAVAANFRQGAIVLKSPR
jgi:hypothetical protein